MQNSKGIYLQCSFVQAGSVAGKFLSDPAKSFCRSAVGPTGGDIAGTECIRGLKFLNFPSELAGAGSVCVAGSRKAAICAITHQFRRGWRKTSSGKRMSRRRGAGAVSIEKGCRRFSLRLATRLRFPATANCHRPAKPAQGIPCEDSKRRNNELTRECR